METGYIIALALQIPWILWFLVRPLWRSRRRAEAQLAELRKIDQARTEAQWKRFVEPDFGEMHHIPGDSMNTMHHAGILCCPLGEPEPINGAPSSAPRRSRGRANGPSP